MEVTSADASRVETHEISFKSRLKRAFSIRNNLRLLFVPPERRLRPLDGWRGLSILWVIVFHAGWYIGRHVPVPIYAELVFSSWMLPVWRGNFGVDVFFVLSGFLIAGMLADERSRKGKIAFVRFYLRRLARLWPALAVAVFLNVLITHDHVESVWANLLYISNFIPILQASMAWTWSLSIEEQFYLVCPWVVAAITPLRPRVRVLILFALAAGLCAIAARVTWAGRFHAIDFEVVVNRPFLRWAKGYDHLYVKPWMRAGPLLMGVIASYLYRMERVMEAFARQRVLPVVLALVALVVAVLSTHWQLVIGVPRTLEIAYLALFRTTFGAAIAYWVLFSVSRHPVGAALGRALSSRLLYPIGQLAYSAYLLNPLATTVVNQELAPYALTHQLSPLGFLLPFDALATLAAALLLYLFVEKPFMELRDAH